MCLHPLLHALERCFMGMPGHVPALGIGALRLQRAAAAVAAHGIDALLAVHLLERQPFARRALVLVSFRVVGKGVAVE
ncbi:hypothetical protein D3C76_1035560 [compost metagenome]